MKRRLYGVKLSTYMTGLQIGMGLKDNRKMTQEEIEEHLCRLGFYFLVWAYVNNIKVYEKHITFQYDTTNSTLKYEHDVIEHIPKSLR